MSATLSETPAAYLAHLKNHSEEWATLFASLRITYSEFFRNPLTFALIEQIILPGLAEEKRKTGGGDIRIWSAGCAAGQEAYSLAILTRDFRRAHEKGFFFRIFATDASEVELATARRGVYDAAAMQNVPLKHLRGAFIQRGETYEVVPEVKALVQFSSYDLLDEDSTCPPDSIYGDFDLLLCSNLLFYYRPDIRRLILKKLERCLSPGGYLVTGEAESGIVAGAGGFRAIVHPLAAFQKLEWR